MDIQEELYQGIDSIMSRYVDKQNITKQYEGYVVGDSGKDDGRYKVSIQGKTYMVRDGIELSPSPNDAVWVCTPNNDWNKAFICAKKNIYTYTPTGDTGLVLCRGNRLYRKFYFSESVEGNEYCKPADDSYEVYPDGSLWACVADVTDYNFALFLFKSSWHTGTCGICDTLSYKTSISDYASDGGVGCNIVSTATNQENSAIADISNITGKKYIGFCGQTSNTYYVYEIVLMKDFV